MSRDPETVIDRVRQILRDYPYARDNDVYLYILYLRKYDKDISKYINYIPADVFKNATPFESVSRARRHIQNKEGLYKPSKNVRRGRRIKEETYREFYAKLDD